MLVCPPEKAKKFVENYKIEVEIATSLRRKIKLRPNKSYNITSPCWNILLKTNQLKLVALSNKSLSKTPLLHRSCLNANQNIKQKVSVEHVSAFLPTNNKNASFETIKRIPDPIDISLQTQSTIMLRKNRFGTHLECSVCTLTGYSRVLIFHHSPPPLPPGVGRWDSAGRRDGPVYSQSLASSPTGNTQVLQCS